MAETKLDLTGDTAVAQREVDKLTKHVAKLREELRKTNEETKKSKPDGGFAAGLEKLKKSTDAWDKGMTALVANQKGQWGAIKESIQKVDAASTRMFAGWSNGLAAIKVQQTGWVAGMAKLSEQLKRQAEGQFGAFKSAAGGKTGGGLTESWIAGLAKAKDQMDPFKRGLANLKEHQEAYRRSLVPVVTLQDQINGRMIRGAVAARNLGTGLRSAVGSSVAGYVSLATVLGAVTSELTDQLRLEQELAKFHQGAAGSQRGFLRNLGVVSNGERTAALQKIGNISQQTGVPETQLYGAATQATAAKGALSNLQALEAVRVAAMVAPDDPTELAATTGGLLDTASLTGSSNAMENLGVIAALGEQTRVGTLKDISENLVPAAIGVKGFGGSTGDAAALVTAMTQATKDTTGRMSGTASISLAKQLAEFMPNEADTASRIAKLQGNATLRKKFMAQASFESKALIPSRDLLTGGTATAELFQQNRGAYATGDAAAAQGRKFIAGLNSTGLQAQAAGMRSASQAAESLKLKRTEAARSGGAYQAFDEIQEAAGFGWTSRMVGKAQIAAQSLFTGSTNEAAAQVLEGHANVGQGGPFAAFEDKHPETAAAFRDMAKHLRSLDQKTAPQPRKPNIDAHVE